ncbi:MAG: tRNA (adenine(22)-N(1))-methyltransferase TrmK [Lachnospiraceae bacterium]
MNTGKNGLSRRLQRLLVSPGKRVCDVGCDHGYVSIYLIESGRADAVLAMDVNGGPVERARIDVEKHGLTGYITLRLSNGLDAYRTGGGTEPCYCRNGRQTDAVHSDKG